MMGTDPYPMNSPSHILTYILRPLHSLAQLTSTLTSTALSLATAIVVFVGCLWVSLLLLWSFYYTYIPIVSHVYDINLVFSSDCDSSRGVCSFPSANMSFLSINQEPVLARGQKYSAAIELDMPESPINRDLGMFLVTLDLYTKHGAVVHSAHRAVSAMINYKSSLLSIAETIFFLPLYLFGYFSQKQLVRAELFSSFTEDPFKPTFGAFVQVQSKFVEIYKATLHLTAQFSGLRYIVYNWPLTSGVIGLAMLMSFFMVVLLLSWYTFSSPKDEDESKDSHFIGEIIHENTDADDDLVPEHVHDAGDNVNQPLIEEIRFRQTAHEQDADNFQ